MKWLTKIGNILVKGIQIANGVSPFLSGKSGEIAGKVTSELEQISDVIIQAELFGQILGTPGPDKLKASAPAVAQILLKSAIVAKHKITDEALFMRGATKIADGMADVMNSLKEIETSEVK